MFDVWRAVQWWEEWQLRILVLGSLAIQWFLMLAAPMRKYTIPGFLRSCIWLAYISSDALAIYALATLFNRHAKTTASNDCGGIASKGSILEILWAPILLIHLGGQEELTAYNIEDNEMWTRHTVTLVSQVAVALYAFYKSWPSSSDGKLLASAILLFVIGVISFSEKPWALNRARIKRLADVSASIQGTKKRSKWGIKIDYVLFSDWYNRSFLKKDWSNCFNRSGNKQKSGQSDGNQRNEVLSQVDQVFMILSDMSLLAAADDLEERKRANKEAIWQYMGTRALNDLQRWLRGAFGLIYTRANLVIHPVYLTYHLLVVPTLHITALTLFATSDKQVYNRTDVKVTYILLCFTAALDVLAVFIRQLLYWVMFKVDVPPLCETMRRYNLVDAALRRKQMTIGWLARCATRMGYTEECFDCKGVVEESILYKKVAEMVMADLVLAHDRDLASYRIFTVQEPVGPITETIHDMTEIIQLSSEPAAEVEIMQLGVAPSEIIQLPEKILLHNRARSDEELGGPAGTEKIRQSSSSRAALSQKTTDQTEIRITISTGAESSFSTEHNTDRPAAPRSDEQLQHTTEPQQPHRSNWALDEELQKVCGTNIRNTLKGSFDRSVLVWHIATDLLFRTDPDKLRHLAHDEDSDDDEIAWPYMESAQTISNYMAHLLNSRTEMLLTGSRQHLVTEAISEIGSFLKEVGISGQMLNKRNARTIIEKGMNKEIESDEAAMQNKEDEKGMNKEVESDEAAMQNKEDKKYFHVPVACKLANELLHLPDAEKRWKLIYRAWLGMLFYSASMCRGYLHAKSLGEGGEYLSFVWLFLSLRGAKTLADKLQMLEGDDWTRCEWVFKNKLRPDGRIEKYKARQVAKGTPKKKIQCLESCGPLRLFTMPLSRLCPCRIIEGSGEAFVMEEEDFAMKGCGETMVTKEEYFIIQGNGEPIVMEEKDFRLFSCAFL